MITRVWPRRRLSLHPAVLQGGWALVGQSASSISNVFLTVMVARQATPIEFGIFTLVTAFYFVALTGSRAAISTPLLMACAGASGDVVAREIRGSIGTSFFGSLLLVVPTAITGFIIGGLTGQLLAILGIFTPFLLLQDSGRYAFMAEGRAAWSAALDLIWLALQVTAAITLIHFSVYDIAVYTAVWAAAGGLTGLAGLMALGRLPSLRASWQFLHRHRRLLPHLMGDYAAANLVTQIMPYAVALGAGVAAAGALRAGLVLLGLVYIVISGTTPIAQIEATKLHKQAPHRDNRFIIVWTIVIGAISLLYGALLGAIPDSLGMAMLGEIWPQTASLLLPLTLYLVARSPYNGVEISLYARVRVREAFRLRLVTAPPLVILPALGAMISGASGAAYGLAVAGLCSGLCSVWTITRVSKVERRLRARDHSAQEADGVEPDARLFGQLRRRLGLAMGVTMRFKVYFWILDLPLVSDIYMRARGPLRRSRIRADTCLVIDGYPRSANTYSKYAFLAGNPFAGHVITHVHSPRIVQTAARRGIPCIVLIRQPADAVTSMLQFSPGLSRRAALSYYCRYYNRVLSVRGGIMFADFDEVTSAFGSIIRQCNRRFGTDFGEGDYDERANQRLLEQIEQSTRRLFRGCLNERVVSRPSPGRVPAALILTNLGPKEGELLTQAERLYLRAGSAAKHQAEGNVR